MISIEKLKEYAKIKGFSLGQAEKDYFQEIILFILYKEYGKEIVFKGGTALAKSYGFDRFSEDLDFTAETEEDFQKTISKGLNSFYIEHETAQEKHGKTMELIFRIHGPLYNGNRISLCKISLDISLREKTMLPPAMKRLGIHVEEIPSFELPVMCEEEILAEKIRAILTRNKARDLYDAYYLALKGVQAKKTMIKEKLKDYKEEYTEKKFLEGINAKKDVWDQEMKNLTKEYPSFKEVQSLLKKQEFIEG